jgi:hypothetical protein
LWLEEWRTNVEPAVGGYKVAEQGRYAIALVGLRAGLLLNGGGALALPAYASLLGNDASPGSVNFLAAATFYAAGLALAGLAVLLAYFSADLHSSDHWHMVEYHKANMLGQKQSAFPDNATTRGRDMVAEMKGWLDGAQDFRERARRSAIMAFWLAAGALLAFCIATGAAYTALHAAVTGPA